MWANDKRHGQGTYWRNEGGKLRREYTGDWTEDKRSGRGTFFYKNGDRYDGYWINGQPQGEGRMIYENENIYEGQWHDGKRSGYGVMTKRNGDHFEGHWVDDKREGQGSYYYHDKNKLFVGEWVNDQPKTGVYTEVEDEDGIKPPANPHFTDPYFLPNIPELKLKDPTTLLERAIERTKQERTKFRAQFSPIEEMFTASEIMDLKNAFDRGAQGEEYVNLLSLKTIFQEMDIHPSEEMLNELLRSCGKLGDEDAISFELFARTVALVLEERVEKGSISSHGEEEEDEDASPEGFARVAGKRS